jgi:ribosomal protein L29
MKTKDLVKLRTKKLEELRDLAKKKKLEFVKLAALVKVGEEKNVKKKAGLKQEIAQILTIIREREIVEQEKLELGSASKKRAF